MSDQSPAELEQATADAARPFRQAEAGLADDNARLKAELKRLGGDFAQLSTLAAKSIEVSTEQVEKVGALLEENLDLLEEVRRLKIKLERLQAELDRATKAAKVATSSVQIVHDGIRVRRSIEDGPIKEALMGNLREALRQLDSILQAPSPSHAPAPGPAPEPVASDRSASHAEPEQTLGHVLGAEVSPDGASVSLTLDYEAMKRIKRSVIMDDPCFDELPELEGLAIESIRFMDISGMSDMDAEPELHWDRGDLDQMDAERKL